MIIFVVAFILLKFAVFNLNINEFMAHGIYLDKPSPYTTFVLK